jgi:membrane associated rhomboid family serine protease
VSTGGPDLFVICKSCGSEVSPYITECPYCGNRLRKRAPKLDREGRVTEKRRRRPPTPSLPRLKRGEIPGIRGDTRPYATIVLLVASFAGCLLWRAAVIGQHAAIELWAVNGSHLWWRLLVAPFTYATTGYAFVTLSAIGVYGWLMERRHGPAIVLLLFAAGAIGGAAASIGASHSFWIGANGGALALMVAWAIPDVLAARAGEEIEGDMIGTAVFAAAVALMPLATTEASWLSDAVGVLAGVVLGLPLARMQQVR